MTSGPNRGEEFRQEFAGKAERITADIAASRVDKTAGRTDGVTASATVSYFLGLKTALRPQPLNPETAAKDIDHLPTLGVDPELVRQAQDLTAKMWDATRSAHSLSERPVLSPFRLSANSKFEAQLKDMVAQCRVIERMRADLTARYGMEFPPLDLPTP